MKGELARRIWLLLLSTPGSRPALRGRYGAGVAFGRLSHQDSPPLAGKRRLPHKRRRICDADRRARRAGADRSCRARKICGGRSFYRRRASL
ncbi:hypothetical protein Micbo1qcDRAFT_166203, partial [Microdochium bolleyi]